MLHKYGQVRMMKNGFNANFFLLPEVSECVLQRPLQTLLSTLSSGP